jgi:hypothetical protein
MPPVAITYVEDKPLRSLSRVLDKYAASTDYDALWPEGNVVQLLLTGPLVDPLIRNRTTGEDVRLKYALADGEESTLYVFMDNAVGNLIYRLFNMTVLWGMAAGGNRLEFHATQGIEDGGCLTICMPN